jgi:hypothetical protein
MARAHILKGFPDLESALWVHKHHPGHSIRQMVRLAQENGYEVTQPIRYDIAQILDEWGLADKHTRTLTPKGEAFYSLCTVCSIVCGPEKHQTSTSRRGHTRQSAIICGTGMPCHLTTKSLLVTSTECDETIKISYRLTSVPPLVQNRLQVLMTGWFRYNRLCYMVS